MNNHKFPIELEANYKRVANMLKKIVNGFCVEGFSWYEDVDDEDPTFFDLNVAIGLLEKQETKTLTIVDDMEGYHE